MGDEQQANERYLYKHIEQMIEGIREIVQILEPYRLIRLFKIINTRMLNDDYDIVIKADKTTRYTRTM